MTPGEHYPCLLCLAPSGEGMVVRLDKFQRPYLHCDTCQSKIFFKVRSAWRGPERLWGALHLALIRGDADAGRVLIAQEVEAHAGERAAG